MNVKWDTKKLPDTLVVKRSYVPIDQSGAQRDVFKGLHNIYGIANVASVFPVIDDDGNSYCTDQDMTNDPSFWNIFRLEISKEPEPESRVLVMVVYESDGQPLDTAGNIGQLVTGVLHASVGTWR
jgi:hypothetical protein